MTLLQGYQEFFHLWWVLQMGWYTLHTEIKKLGPYYLNSVLSLLKKEEESTKYSVTKNFSSQSNLTTKQITFSQHYFFYCMLKQQTNNGLIDLIFRFLRICLNKCFSMATILDRKDNYVTLKFYYVIGKVMI